LSGSVTMITDAPQVPPVTAYYCKTLQWGPAPVLRVWWLPGTRRSSTGPCASSAAQWA